MFGWIEVTYKVYKITALMWPTQSGIFISKCWCKGIRNVCSHKTYHKQFQETFQWRPVQDKWEQTPVGLGKRQWTSLHEHRNHSSVLKTGLRYAGHLVTRSWSAPWQAFCLSTNDQPLQPSGCLQIQDLKYSGNEVINTLHAMQMQSHDWPFAFTVVS